MLLWTVNIHLVVLHLDGTAIAPDSNRSEDAIILLATYIQLCTSQQEGSVQNEFNLMIQANEIDPSKIMSLNFEAIPFSGYAAILL